MVNSKVTYLSAFSDLSEQIFFVSEVVAALGNTKLSENREGVVFFPRVPARDIRALEFVCQKLCKSGVLDDARIEDGRVYFRAATKQKRQINLPALWSK